MKLILPPVVLVLWTSFSIFAQQNLSTAGGWPYEVLREGRGKQLSRNLAAETHNRLVDADGRELVSTYAIGVTDYQVIADLSPAFQNACEVMREGGHYIFRIPLQDFKAAVKNGANLNLPGDFITWEVELFTVLPALPDIASRMRAVIQEKGTEAAFRHFQELRDSGADEVYFGEWKVNEAGYLMLNQGLAKEAIEIFDFNVQRYPESANAHDSLAEAYLKAGDKQMAARHYRRSLELNPQNENAGKMLKGLE
jgi:tetratricopeptide (TPR) repeat protein